MLAAAGVKRLGLDRLVTEVLPPEIVLPAIGQGALGIEIREWQGGRESREACVTELVKALDHSDTHTAVRAERAMLRRLGGGCQVPIAALAGVEGGAIHLRGLIASTDGTRLVRGERRGARAEPETVGHALAEDLLDRGGQAILKDIGGGSVGG
jgi:hydroxymethylbilane synthase